MITRKTGVNFSIDFLKSIKPMKHVMLKRFLGVAAAGFFLSRPYSGCFLFFSRSSWKNVIKIDFNASAHLIKKFRDLHQVTA